MKGKDGNKDRVISFRISQDDFIEFEEKLKISNMSKSEFFREIFIKSNVNLTIKQSPSKDLKKMIFIMNKASNNLNQLAFKINGAFLSGKVSEHLFLSNINALVDIRELLISAVSDVN